ncbi:MAG TPA: hypothetical protein VKU19_19415 [Bryobacteraceae bacterium]|nr:hypothetical protein [Bryobacteraceae bacterium]
MPDFSQPGTDGAVPPDVAEWREGLGGLTIRGLIYTGEGARIALPCDRTHRIVTTFKHRASKDRPVTNYAEVYHRVDRLTRARAAEISCGHGDELHSRIVSQIWTSLPAGTYEIPMASLITELSCPRGTCPTGEAEPTWDGLSAPGGTPRETFARIAVDRSDEIYNEYDWSDPETRNVEPYSFSYGERVASCDAIDYGPFVTRAQSRACFYHAVLAGFSRDVNGSFRVLRRQWWSVPDHLVVVVVKFQA